MVLMNKNFNLFKEKVAQKDDVVDVLAKLSKLNERAERIEEVNE